MRPTPVIPAVCKRLINEFQAHTILLYGSRANDTHTEDSDYDIAAFGPNNETLRVTNSVEATYLDVFIYPTQSLTAPSTDLLHLRDSKILCQRGTEAEKFLRSLRQLFDAGPPKLSSSEVQARQNWHLKMALRMRRHDVEGDFRRSWLLTALLEDYFALRQIWYQDPKKSFAWLSLHDEVGLKLFETALTPGASHDAIEQLVRHVRSDA